MSEEKWFWEIEASLRPWDPTIANADFVVGFFRDENCLCPMGDAILFDMDADEPFKTTFFVKNKIEHVVIFRIAVKEEFKIGNDGAGFFHIEYNANRLGPAKALPVSVTWVSPSGLAVDRAIKQKAVLLIKLDWIFKEFKVYIYCDSAVKHESLMKTLLTEMPDLKTAKSAGTVEKCPL